jgi:hypothetical protein
MSWGNRDEIVGIVPQRSDRARIEASLDLRKKSGKFRLRKRVSTYNTSQMEFEALHCGFPQSSKVGSRRRNKMPGYLVIG